jgi:hypothetical protein
MLMQKRSSWNLREVAQNHDDDTAAGGAAGGSSAAHDLQQIISTKDCLLQQQHRVRGVHGKLKKLSTKYASTTFPQHFFVTLWPTSPPPSA